jgi:hypothetical protein
MSIQSFRVANFKAIHDLDIDPTGVNVLVGANSLGKSSLIHSLLALHQTLASKSEFSINIGGSLVQFGDPNDLVHNSPFHESGIVTWELEVTESKSLSRPQFLFHSGVGESWPEEEVREKLAISIEPAPWRVSSTHALDSFHRETTYSSEPGIAWVIHYQEGEGLTFRLQLKEGNSIDIAYRPEPGRTIYFSGPIVFLATIAKATVSVDASLPKKLHPAVAPAGRDLFWKLAKIAASVNQTEELSKEEIDAFSLYVDEDADGMPSHESAYLAARAVFKGVDPEILALRPMSVPKIIGDGAADQEIRDLLPRLEQSLFQAFNFDPTSLLARVGSDIQYDVDYLGPLRKVKSNDQLFHASPFASSRFGASAEHLAFELLRAEKLTIDAKYLPPSAETVDSLPLVDAINSWLKYLGMGESLAIRKAPHFDPLLEVGGKSFTQVGAGYSQLIPVIAQGLLATHWHKRNTFVLVEQPELHLHPDLQRHLADFFLRVSSASDGVVSFFVESHSEYLLTRLRLLVARQEYDSKSLKIIFFEKPEDKASCTAITQVAVGETGLLNYWPKGFFDAAILDKYELSALQHGGGG